MPQAVLDSGLNVEKLYTFEMTENALFKEKQYKLQFSNFHTKIETSLPENLFLSDFKKLRKTFLTKSRRRELTVRNVYCLRCTCIMNSFLLLIMKKETIYNAEKL